MAELTVPTVDFSGLGELPKVYKDARTTANREMLLSQLGTNPNEQGINALAMRAAQSGDLAGATSLATLGKTLAAPEQTDFIKNYQFAVKNGFQGTPFEYETAIKKAGATRVNTTVQSGERAYDQEVGKDYGGVFTGLQKDARNSVGAINNLNLMENLTKNPNFYSGSGGELVTQAKKLAVSLGIADAKSAAPNELFKKLSQKAVLDSAGGSLGTGFSNADRSFIEGTVANPNNTIEGNLRIIDVSRTIEKRKQDIARVARDYAKTHGGRIDAGFDEHLQRWVEQNPAFPQANQGNAQPGAAQQVTPKQAPDGNFYVPDPKRPGKYLKVVQ